MTENGRSRVATSGRSLLLCCVIITVGLGLVVSISGTALAGSQAAAVDDVPEPLEEGFYSELTIGDGETVEYEVELGAGDAFALGASHDPTVQFEVQIYAPDGAEIGQPFFDDGFSAADVMDVPEDGTYTVVIANDGPQTTFDMEVFHEVAESAPDDTLEDHDPDPVPEPIETGFYDEQTIDAGDSVVHTAHLSAGDAFFAAIGFDPTDDLSLTVYDSSGTPVGEEMSEDSFDEVALPEVPADDEYYVVIENHGNADAVYGLDVYHDQRDQEAEPEPEPETDGLPSQLQEDYYSALGIDAGATDTAPIDLEAGETVVAMAQPSGGPDAVDVSVLDAEGTVVSDENAAAGLYHAEDGGTYAIEVENHADSALQYNLQILTDDRGTSIDGGIADESIAIEDRDQHFYTIDLAAGDAVSMTVSPDDPNAIDAVLMDPDIQDPIEEFDPADGAFNVQLDDVDEAGTYLLAVFPEAGPTSYDLQVDHVGTDDDETADEEDGGTDDDESDERQTDDADGDAGLQLDGTPGFGGAATVVALATVVLGLSRRFDRG